MAKMIEQFMAEPGWRGGPVTAEMEWRATYDEAKADGEAWLVAHGGDGVDTSGYFTITKRYVLEFLGPDEGAAT
jgi:hypothetical protein